MEGSVVHKTLVIMVSLWLDEQLIAFIRKKASVFRPLGLDSTRARVSILSLLGKTLQTLKGRPSINQETLDIAGMVMAGVWVESELTNLKRQVGGISKAVGLSGHQVYDFVSPLLAQVSEVLLAAYSSGKCIPSAIPPDDKQQHRLKVDAQGVEVQVLKSMVGLWFEERFRYAIHYDDTLLKVLGGQPSRVYEIIPNLPQEVLEASILGQGHEQPDNCSDTRSTVTMWLGEQLKSLVENSKKLSAVIGIQPNTVVKCVIPLLGEICGDLRNRYDELAERHRSKPG